MKWLAKARYTYGDAVNFCRYIEAPSKEIALQTLETGYPIQVGNWKRVMVKLDKYVNAKHFSAQHISEPLVFPRQRGSSWGETGAATATRQRTVRHQTGER